MPTDIEQMLLNMGGKNGKKASEESEIHAEDALPKDTAEETKAAEEVVGSDAEINTPQEEIVPETASQSVEEQKETHTALPSRKKKTKHETDSIKQTEHVTIGTFPKDLFTLIKQSFVNYEPEYGESKVTQKEYLEAYVYAHEGCPSNIKVSKRIRDMAACMKKDDTMMQIKDTTIRLAREMQALTDELDILKLLELYDIYDQHGFREGPMQGSADTVNYLRESDKIERLSAAAERDAKKLRVREEEKKHRL